MRSVYLVSKLRYLVRYESLSGGGCVIPMSPEGAWGTPPGQIMKGKHRLPVFKLTKGGKLKVLIEALVSTQLVIIDKTFQF